MNANMVAWFEVPVTDMDRAIRFYETVFKVTITKQVLDEIVMGWFPFAESGNGAPGSLVYNKEFYTPSKEGSLLYFSSQAGDLSIELSRVAAAGGEVVQEKIKISNEIGFMGVFIDSEGNRVALYERPS